MARSPIDDTTELVQALRALFHEHTEAAVAVTALLTVAFVVWRLT